MSATEIQLFGSWGFGAIIGWYVYYINRYRKTDVQFSDLVTLIGILGGSTVLTLFPSNTDLFGAYGVGLACGFFGYFVVLLLFVSISKNFDVDWFLDGRRKNVKAGYFIPEFLESGSMPMGITSEDDNEDEQG